MLPKLKEFDFWIEIVLIMFKKMHLHNYVMSDM